MGESQGAEDEVRGEGGEEADDDEGGEQDEGGGEHGCPEQGLSKLAFDGINSGSEEGKDKRKKARNCGVGVEGRIGANRAVLQIFAMSFVEESSNSAAN